MIGYEQDVENRSTFHAGELLYTNAEMGPNPKTLLISIPQRNSEADTGGQHQVRPLWHLRHADHPKGSL